MYSSVESTSFAPASSDETPIDDAYAPVLYSLLSERLPIDPCPGPTIPGIPVLLAGGYYPEPEPPIVGTPVLLACGATPGLPARNTVRDTPALLLFATPGLSVEDTTEFALLP